MHAGGVRRKARAERARERDPRRELLGAELAQVLLAHTGGARRRDVLAKAGELGPVARDGQHAAFDELGLDAVAREHPRDLLDGVEHRPLEDRVGARRAAALIAPRRAGEEP